MADAPYVAQLDRVRTRAWLVRIGATDKWLAATVEIGEGYSLTPIVLPAVGQTPVAHLVTGYPATVRIGFLETTMDQVAEALSVQAGGLPVAVSDRMPPVTIAIRDPMGAADDAVCIPQAVRTSVGFGELNGMRVINVTFTVEQPDDAALTPWFRGDPADL